MTQYRANQANIVPNNAQKDILIVEDDLDLVEVYRALLEADGWHVIATATCKDACLQLLGECVPGILVLDLGLPDCDGLEILETIRRGGIQIHVIVVSGCGNIPRALACVQAGAAEYIEKPIEPSHFLAAINKYYQLPTLQYPLFQQDVQESRGCAGQELSEKPLQPLATNPPQSQTIKPSPLSRSYFYVCTILIILALLGSEFAFLQYLEQQANERTEILQTHITRSLHTLERGSKSSTHELVTAITQSVQSLDRESQKELVNAIHTQQAFEDVIKAINNYKKTRRLSKANDFKVFYVAYFAKHYWHVKPDVFIAGLKKASIPQELVPKSGHALLEIKRAHVKLLKRVMRHIKNTKYKNDIVSKKDRKLNTYRIKGDLNYGSTKLPKKKKPQCISYLKQLITTYQLDDAFYQNKTSK